MLRLSFGLRLDCRRLDELVVVRRRRAHPSPASFANSRAIPEMPQDYKGAPTVLNRMPRGRGVKLPKSGCRLHGIRVKRGPGPQARRCRLLVPSNFKNVPVGSTWQVVLALPAAILPLQGHSAWAWFNCPEIRVFFCGVCGPSARSAPGPLLIWAIACVMMAMTWHPQLEMETRAGGTPARDPTRTARPLPARRAGAAGRACPGIGARP
jgi:hypothetical protein